MATPPHIEDHKERALDRQLGQFADKPRFEAMIGILAAQTQEAEDALYQLYTDTWIDVATGDALLQWGKLYRFPKAATWTDDRYRALLQAWILILLSKGSAEELIEILKRLATADVVELFTIRPAQLSLEYQASIYGTDPGWALSIPAYLQRAAAGGILIAPVIERTDQNVRYSVDGTGYSVGTYGLQL